MLDAPEAGCTLCRFGAACVWGGGGGGGHTGGATSLAVVPRGAAALVRVVQAELAHVAERGVAGQATVPHMLLLEVWACSDRRNCLTVTVATSAPCSSC